MTKKLVLTVVLIFISWFVIDYFLHGILLRPLYETTVNLWRPSDQMNIPLVYIVTFVLILCFVSIYTLLINPKSIPSGLKYGTILGVITGTASGFGTYLHMPVPLKLAVIWFFGGLIKAIAAGLILGIIIKANK
jgi:hypothetical protein